MASIDMSLRAPWSRHQVGNACVWVAGHFLVGGRSFSGAEAAHEILTTVHGGESPNRFDGHYACVIDGPEGVLAFVDRVSSIPLFVYRDEGRATVTNDPVRFARRKGLAIDDVQALSVAMAGYTTGPDTLFQGLRGLPPSGKLILGGAGGDDAVDTYDIYDPWRAPYDAPFEEDEVLEALGTIFSRLSETLQGRPVAVPLSAGLDSRIVVAGLRQFGHDDVRCFAYGRPGNFEAEASRRIAEHLGLPWRFVRTDTATMRDYFQSTLRREYWNFADLACATVFEQDVFVVSRLRDEEWLPENCVIVNGQSGDFITGNHIPAALTQDHDEMAHVLELALLEKHYSLWKALRTPDNDAQISKLLRQESATTVGTVDEAAVACGLFEYMELRNRQSKYVISGQRAYDFLEMDWRMPLWERPFLDLWKRAPLTARFKQRAYRSALERGNWGGVWGPDWNFQFSPPPSVALPLRWLIKGVCALLRRQVWRKVDRRLFAYWTGAVPNYAVVPYRAVVGDQRGFRNAISFLTEKYLARYGLSWNGQQRIEKEAREES